MRYDILIFVKKLPGIFCFLFSSTHCLQYLYTNAPYFVVVCYVRSNKAKAMYSSGVTALLIIIFLPGQSTCKRTAYLYYSSQGQAGGRPGLYVSGDAM